jgi:hypothetical protein
MGQISGPGMQGDNVGFPAQTGLSRSLHPIPEQRKKCFVSRKPVVTVVGEAGQAAAKWDCVEDKYGRGWKKSIEKGIPQMEEGWEAQRIGDWEARFAV